MNGCRKAFFFVIVINLVFFAFVESQAPKCAGHVISQDRRAKLSATIKVKRCTGSDQVNAPLGLFNLEITDCDACSALELIAVPSNSDSYLAERVLITCEQKSVEILLPRKPDFDAIIGSAVQDSQWGHAALIRNEYLAREQLKDPSFENHQVEEQIYAEVAKQLDVPKNQALYPDPDQRKLVISPELKEAIVAFQKERNLSSKPGILDFETLKALAEESVPTGSIGAAPSFEIIQ